MSHTQSDDSPDDEEVYPFLIDAPWTNGLVEGMNRLLQEYLRCIINGNDTRYTE